jgi:mono/diheme cytochrome c family protein
MLSVVSLSLMLKKNTATSLLESLDELDSLSVVEVEHQFGEPLPNHYMKKYDAELAKIGAQLINEGKAGRGDRNGKLISSYFNCTDCHNLVKETKELTNLDPQDRLDYLVKNDLPFTAGSTFFGIYNRSTFYNDDYYKKYGDLVNDAKDTLANAIQLCAEYCASGRKLVDWELNAILHYFKKHELRLGDLDLSEGQKEIILSALREEKNEAEAVEIIKGSYIHRYGATFTGAKIEKERGYGGNGDPKNGEKIYKAACMYCHENARVTYLDLNDDVLSGKYLWRHRKGYDDLSIYQVVRWGTYPIAGRKQYMPLYPEEKMSDKQLEDLMAYIKKLAKK